MYINIIFTDIVINKLPDTVKNSLSVDDFKVKLKTHLFKLAFSLN